MTPFTDAKWCPPKLDANRYKDRNVVERFFSRAKKCRALLLDLISTPSTIEAARSTWHRCLPRR
ncbi:TPA: transposase [Corynebacterium striatum]|nr:transposase [Corynebacterium striatum]